jgi:UDP-N-acetylmuramyl pentapeptide phosphotransferase/UDP-N-acetylglucosamine-1-phosphate transferase
MEVLRMVLVHDIARALLVAVVAFVLTLFVGRWWVHFARRNTIGKRIRILAEALSVMLQVGYFKWTKKRFGVGRRIFKIAPLHHHFELLGCSQVQVMQRFVLVSMVAAMVGISLALFFSLPDVPQSTSDPLAR